MWPWPYKRSKVTWWPDIDNGSTLVGFLDPENHILDILITFVAFIHPEITLIDHLGHATLTNYGFQGHVMVRNYWFDFIWIPWLWTPYPWHFDHICSINTSWDNVDQSFRSCAWPWPTMVSKVTWGSDIIDFILFGFLDPENHILDILIVSVALNSFWDNVDRPFRPCDLDQLWFPRSRDGQILLILSFSDSLTLKTISLTLWSPL